MDDARDSGAGRSPSVALVRQAPPDALFVLDGGFGDLVRLALGLTLEGHERLATVFAAASAGGEADKAASSRRSDTRAVVVGLVFEAADHGVPIVRDTGAAAAALARALWNAGDAVLGFPLLHPLRDRVRTVVAVRDALVARGRREEASARALATAGVEHSVDATMEIVRTGVVPRVVPDLLDDLIPYLAEDVVPKVVDAIVPYLVDDAIPRILDGVLPSIEEEVVPRVVSEVVQDPRMHDLLMERGRGAVKDAADAIRGRAEHGDDEVEVRLRRLFRRPREPAPDGGTDGAP